MYISKTFSCIFLLYLIILIFKSYNQFFGMINISNLVIKLQWKWNSLVYLDVASYEYTVQSVPYISTIHNSIRVVRILVEHLRKSLKSNMYEFNRSKSTFIYTYPSKLCSQSSMYRYTIARYTIHEDFAYCISNSSRILYSYCIF